MLHGEGNKRFEMPGGGIRYARLPFTNRFTGDAEVLSETRLAQTDHAAQGQKGLSKGVVSFSVPGWLHQHALSGCSETSVVGWEVQMTPGMPPLSGDFAD